MGIQLTLEEHELKLRRSTYTWIFFSTKYSVLHDAWLVESVDEELQIRRADYKLFVDF